MCLVDRFGHSVVQVLCVLIDLLYRAFFELMFCIMMDDLSINLSGVLKSPVLL